MQKAISIIRAIVDDRCRAANERDAEKMIANVSDDITIFDVIGGMRSVGRQSARGRAEEWINSYAGPIRWDIHEFRASASAEVAYCHFISRVQGTLVSGDVIDMWYRSTLGLELREGAWLIAHDHGSDPFDPQTGLVNMDAPEES